jgi:hypothetical protein
VLKSRVALLMVSISFKIAYPCFRPEDRLSRIKKTGSDTGRGEDAELVIFILSPMIYRHTEYIIP